MKLKLRGQRTEQIKAGVEPWETAEVEVDLAALTPEQRAIVAENTGHLFAVEATPEAALAALDREIARREERARKDRDRDDQRQAEIRAKMEDRKLRESCRHVEGVKVPHWEVPVIFLGWIASDDELAVAVRAQTATLKKEAERLNAAALAAAQPEIAAAEEAAKAEKKAMFARRLETGIVEIPFSRDDRREWGEPWIAKIEGKTNGRRPEYDFSEGSYDAAKEVLSIPCKPGEMIAYGQKNYKKERRTVHEIRRMEEDGRLVSA